MNTEESELLPGIAGAIIGSFLGVLAIVLLGQIGYVAVISGVVMGFGTFMGYSMLGGSLDKKGLVASIIIMIIMIYFANRINWALFIVRAVPDASFLKAFFRLSLIVEQNAEIASKYNESLMADYIFCALGAFSFIKRNNNQ